MHIVNQEIDVKNKFNSKLSSINHKPNKSAKDVIFFLASMTRESLYYL